MKMLETKETDCRNGFTTLQITYQDERLRNPEPYSNNNSERTFGEYNGIRFISNHMPYYDQYKCVFCLRGTERRSDNNVITVPVSHLPNFLKAICLFNNAMEEKFDSEKNEKTDKTNPKSINNDPVMAFLISQVAEVSNKAASLYAQEKAIKEQLKAVNMQLDLLKKQERALSTLNLKKS